MKRPSPRSVLLLFGLGLSIRLLPLPYWGTVDTKQWKAWTVQAVREGLATVYGPPDGEILQAARATGQGTLRALLTMPFPRAVFPYRGEVFFVDYPPGSMTVLWAMGRLHALFDPDGLDPRLLNVFVNFPPLVGSIALAWLLRGSASGVLGETRALVFWLNPAVLLGTLMGYQDALFGAVAIAAVMALDRRQYVLSAALVVAAGLLKPQASLLLPTFAALLVVEAGWRAWPKALLAGTATAALILSPWWLEGRLLSALDGCRRPLEEITLSAQSLNLWWIVGWAMQWLHAGDAWPLARILTFPDVQNWFGWDPRGLSRLLLGLGTLANVVLLLRSPRQDPARVPLSIALQTHLYALCGTSVHENHTFLAVFVSPLLLGLWDKARRVVVLTSTFLFLNLFLLEGLGRGILRDRQLYRLRRIVGLDLSVIVAAAHVALLIALFVWAYRRSKASVPAAG